MLGVGAQPECTRMCPAATRVCPGMARCTPQLTRPHTQEPGAGASGCAYPEDRGLGLHCMQTFSGHIAGQQIYVEKKYGIFCHPHRHIFCLTGSNPFKKQLPSDGMPAELRFTLPEDLLKIGQECVPQDCSLLQYNILQPMQPCV
eukprot:Gb_12477 [translate_table: standard]